MDEASKAIIKSIDSGEYFEDAKKWYYDKYISVNYHKYYIGIFAILVLTFGLLIIGITLENYQSIKTPFPIFAKDQSTYYPRIKSLGKGYTNMNQAIANYILKSYIVKRERYMHIDLEPKNWNLRLKHIKALSSGKTFRQFNNYVQPSTSNDSPVLKYKKHTQRFINVKSMKLLPEEGIVAPDLAIAEFEARELSRQGEKITKHIARISFVMPDFYKGNVTKKINFKIIGYDTEQVR